jgi:hypothetical protein
LSSQRLYIWKPYFTYRVRWLLKRLWRFLTILFPLLTALSGVFALLIQFYFPSRFLPFREQVSALAEFNMVIISEVLAVVLLSSLVLLLLLLLFSLHPRGRLALDSYLLGGVLVKFRRHNAESNK